MEKLSKEKMEEILNYRFEARDIEVNLSIKDFLKTILKKVWKEEQCFDGKRPFGNSGWQQEIYDILIENKVVDEKAEESEMCKIIVDLINYM
jgi:hypothetical protein